MIRVKVERAWSTDGYNLWIIKYDRERKKSWVSEPINLVMREMPGEGWLLPEPTLQLTSGPMGDAEELLRALVEGIMEAGLAPAVSLDNAKQVQALENNLKDLREISKSLLIPITKA